MDAKLFEFWFEFCLIPQSPACSTFALDNASFHSKKRLTLLNKKHGHRVVFLPPYSPELNPIENFWSWLKGKLKKILPVYNDFDEALCYCFNGI
jgi:transposase